MGHFLSFTSCLLNVVAFVLLLLVSLSGLVIKSIYILILPYVHEFGHDLRIGVLGFCQTDYELSTTTTCYGPQRGYTIPFDLVRADGLASSVAGMLDSPTTSILILHPIAAGFALLSAIFSLLNGRPLMGTALSFTLWNAVFATVAFAFDIVVVETAKSRVDSGVFQVYWGSAPWMTLVAAIFIWISVLLSAIKLWTNRRSRKSMEVEGLLALVVHCNPALTRALTK
ncbi:hypothetical protein GALMADRAFT_144137 [Galerina marginata CBS 339.88]|uniref:Pali-domain-containing protein n=1 Tax=Galerina marginata (strain CBS 339.88) TaxID=685588 RepID=A0A067SJD9_GALM3|nr:hypothetical protein GALMADRAFT_144137 [Galerina marginata CBS 339.88]